MAAVTALSWKHALRQRVQLNWCGAADAQTLGRNTAPFETKMTSAASILTVGIRLAGSGVIWPTRAIGRASSERQATAPAGAATIAVTIRGRGHPAVRIQSRGRASEDFDDLFQGLVDAGSG